MKKYLKFLTIGLIMNSTPSMGLNIVTVEEPNYKNVLQTPAALVSFPLSTEDHLLIQAMKEKLYVLEGVGLAAPQVNVAKKIIVIYIPENAALLRENVRPYPMHVMINPSYKAVEHSAIEYDMEACYSVSSKAGKVPRYQKIVLHYFDEAGKEHQQEEKGFYARVLQHEIDHLNGLLIIDRLTADCVQGSLAEMRELRRSELSEEKRVLFDALMAKKKS